MSRTPTKHRPTLHVYIVEGEGETAYWTKIGAAWANEDGEGFNVQLAAVPLHGRLVIRKPKPQAERGAGQWVPSPLRRSTGSCTATASS